MDDLDHSPRGDRRYGVLARLKPGVTTAQAQSEMNELTARLARDHSDTDTGLGAVVIPINSIIGAAKPAFAVLFAAVVFLLLIACANVSGLLLARGAGRTREIAVRASLGASTTRIARQLLAESSALAILGGSVGLLLAGWSLSALRNALPDVVPRLKEMGVDSTVLVFTFIASLLTGVLFGILPAMRLARSGAGSLLQKSGGRGNVPGSRSSFFLLTGEVALAVVLLSCAGLLAHSFARLTSVDPGFHPDNLLTMRLSLPHARYADPVRRAAFTRAVLDRVEALPGVRAAGTIDVLPMRTYFLNLPAYIRSYRIEGEAEAGGAARPAEDPNADYRTVNRGFLAAMGVALRAGRDFTRHDDERAPAVALVNETLARRCCAGQTVTGKHIRINGKVREIVGIIQDIRLTGFDGTVRPAVFAPNDQEPAEGFSLLVRTSAEPLALSSAVRRAILTEDSEQPVSDVRSMQEVIADALLLRRLSTSLLSAFAGLALLLAGVGIYSVIAYSVSRRTHEIGLRMALGAERPRILRMVLSRGLGAGIAGVAIGTPIAMGAPRVLRTMLFGIPRLDPLVFVGVPVLLLLIAAAASAVPALRAIRVDPAVALREE
jgi:putative ABC transport system permease protein